MHSLDNPRILYPLHSRLILLQVYLANSNANTISNSYEVPICLIGEVKVIECNQGEDEITGRKGAINYFDYENRNYNLFGGIN